MKLVSHTLETKQVLVIPYIKK